MTKTGTTHVTSGSHMTKTSGGGVNMLSGASSGTAQAQGQAQLNSGGSYTNKPPSPSTAYSHIANAGPGPNSHHSASAGYGAFSIYRSTSGVAPVSLQPAAKHGTPPGGNHYQYAIINNPATTVHQSQTQGQTQATSSRSKSPYARPLSAKEVEV